MAEVVKLVVASDARRLSVEEAWERFVAAKARSERTLSLEDGLAAGKAYREFCDLFLRRAS